MTNACFRCKGDYQRSITTYCADTGKRMIVVRNVPCLECKICGGIAYEDVVSTRLDDIIKHFSDLMIELAVVDYTDSKTA